MVTSRRRRFSLTRHPRWLWALPLFGLLLIALVWVATSMHMETINEAHALSTSAASGPASLAQSLPGVDEIRQDSVLAASVVSIAITVFFATLTLLAVRLQRHREELKSQRALLRELLDNVPSGVTLRRMQPGQPGRFVMWNESNTLMIGTSHDKAIGLTMRDVMPSVHAAELEQLDAEMLASPMVQALVQVRGMPGKGRRTFHLLRTPIFGSAGQVDYIMTNLTDITEETTRTDALRLASKVFETTADGIMMSDIDDRVVMVNRAFSTLTGFDASDIVGKILADSPFRPLDVEASEQRMIRMRRDGFITGEVARNHKDGSPLALWVTGSCVTNGAGIITNYVRVFTDISLLKSTQQKLEQLASHDPLTGLPNRRLLLDRLEQATLRAQRSGGTAAVMFVDLDYFKTVNDTFGHAVGDQLLREVSARMHECIRVIDSIGRLGGDEFAVLLEDTAGRGEAARIAERIIAALSKPFHVDGHHVSIAASIGIAMSPAGGIDGAALLRNADIAMYQAKDAGRNRYRFFQPDVSLAVT